MSSYFNTIIRPRYHSIMTSLKTELILEYKEKLDEIDPYNSMWISKSMDKWCVTSDDIKRNDEFLSDLNRRPEDEIGLFIALAFDRQPKMMNKG